jgi:hypothetical protein
MFDLTSSSSKLASSKHSLTIVSNAVSPLDIPPATVLSSFDGHLFKNELLLF